MQAPCFKPKTLFALVTILFTCSFVLAAEPAAKTANKPAQPNPQPASTGIAVTVNGIDITESQVDGIVQPQIEKISQGNAGGLPPVFIEQYKKRIRDNAIDRLINEQLLDEAVKKANIVVTEQDVINHLKETGAQQKPPLSLEEIKGLIEAQGQKFEDVKNNIRQSKGMKYKKLIEAQFVGKLSFTDEDAQKYYNDNKSQFETPEQVRASHILIAPDKDPNVDPNVAKAKAKAKAQGLLKKIKDGNDFATLAKENSTCSSSPKGGDLGYFSREKMVKPFSDAAFSLKVGQVSDVVETEYGYHIITVTDRKDATVTPFEKAKADIMEMLARQKKTELANTYIESLKSAAKIVYPAGKEPNTPAMISPPASPNSPSAK